jgi:hypothetical protein
MSTSRCCTSALAASLTPLRKLWLAWKVQALGKL